MEKQSEKVYCEQLPQMTGIASVLRLRYTAHNKF